MVFEAVLADVAQQFLQMRDFDYAGATEGVQRIVGEFAFAYIAANFSRRSLVENRAKLMLRLSQPTQVPKVFSFPTVPAMICLEIHLTSRKKCLGRLLQWKHTALSGSSP